jgi:hypothetical protein
LKEALGAIVEDVSGKLNDCARNFSVYSNFIDQLVSERPEKKTDESRLVSS